MQQKNIFLLLALSGSVLMMMLVSVLFFVPTPSYLQADMTRELTVPTVKLEAPVDRFYSGRETDEILQTIQEYVRDNDPDAAKKLYDELYVAHRSRVIMPMGGEVSGEVNSTR